MEPRTLKRLSLIYLLAVPLIGFVLAFGIGHVSYKIYLPLWLFNACLMILASWLTGLHVVRLNNESESRLAKTAFALLIPWILISMFAGLGPPPDSVAEWVATATEQQIRYFMLVISGVFVTIGFVGLRERLKEEGENYYSLLSLISIILAMPLFIINMLYWGYYLSALFKIQNAANSNNLPDWFQPIRQLFGLISVVEVALTYFATFALVMAMRRKNWLSNNSCLIYSLCSLVALAIIILSALFEETFKISGFAVSIPAVPFLMPYFIGIYLLRKLGNRNLKTNPG